jgi:hypothetical protein
VQAHLLRLSNLANIANIANLANLANLANHELANLKLAHLNWVWRRQ